MPPMEEPPLAREAGAIKPDYEALKRPRIPAEPYSNFARNEPDFFARNRNLFWWIMIVTTIVGAAALLLVWESRIIADPGCG